MADDYVQYPHEMRIHDPDTLEEYQRLTTEGVWDLRTSEIWWRDHERFLASHGYRLRPRFRPGWKPSWSGTNIMPGHCEDSFPNGHRKTIDATRLVDGTTVFIKQVPRGSSEIPIAKYLTDAERLQDPRNHCVRVLDHFQDRVEPDIDFIVMPLLRRFDSPPFFAVSEVLDFMHQTLEGLLFIHSQGIAHRDCSNVNIMLDGSPLYPEGFHPSNKITRPSGQRLAKALRRCDVPAVKYYYTDFGMATRFHDPAAPRLVTGRDGQDQQVPELSSHVPYDPFAVDVFILGNLYRRSFTEKYPNMEFLSPLTVAMTQRNPLSRPTAASAFSQFRELVRKRRGYALRWRLRDPDEKAMTRVYWDVFSAAREGRFLVGQLFGRPFLLLTLLLSVSGSAMSLLYGRLAFFTRLRSFFGGIMLRRR